MLNSGYRLSEHFTLEEFMRSDKAQELGIDNTPPADVVEHLRRTATFMEQVRALLGVPLRVTSGYRCHALNAAVGSKPTSDHVTGNAVDFVAPGFGSPLAVCVRLAASDLPFKQLIWEYGRWTHISFDGMTPARREVLTIDDKGTRPGIG